MYSTEKRGGKHRWSYLGTVILVLVTYCAWALLRPLPALQPSVQPSALHTKAPAGTLQWPAQGQSAVGIVGTPILDMHGEEKPVPTASTAKLITALVVLQTKPLQTGEQGPTITLTPDDVTIYNNYVAQDGSLVKVQSGEQISEYQMLQTMMLPSANNMADSLAIWAFGSLKNYQQAANQFLEDHGLVTSHVGSDASGLSPSTTSTAHDMVQIGELVMEDPVLSQIVGQASAAGIPVVGNIKNVNTLLGTDGIIGIKTGNSDQAGGAFVSASKTTVNGKQVTIVTALMGAAGLWEAMHYSLSLVQSAQTNFKPLTVVKSHTPIATYQSNSGSTASAVTQKDISLQAWGGSTVTTKANLHDIKSGAETGQAVGDIAVPKSALNDRLSTTVILQNTSPKPTIFWRLSHPL